MKIFGYIIIYIIINQLLVLLINKLTEFIKFDEDNVLNSHPTLSTKLYILICIFGIFMIFFIKWIRKIRINAYDYNRYIHLKFKMLVFKEIYNKNNDTHNEFITLDRKYKLRQLKNKKWTHRLEHWFSS